MDAANSEQIRHAVETADRFFRLLEATNMTTQTNENTAAPANTTEAGKPIANSLKESVFQYLALLLILLSNFYPTGNWSVFVSLALAFAVFIFSGWVKKIAEVKINELLATSGLKDKEILVLKEVRAKLESELKRLTDKLTDLSNG